MKKRNVLRIVKVLACLPLIPFMALLGAFAVPFLFITEDVWKGDQWFWQVFK